MPCTGCQNLRSAPVLPPVMAGVRRPIRGVGMKYVRVVVNDLMQQSYVYFLTEPIGQNFNPDFRPELTPKEMLELGVFGGKYMTDCTDEFSAGWFVHARLCPERHDPGLNYFGVSASQPLSYWQEKGWIYHEDPRGWFQCSYQTGPACAPHGRHPFENS